MAYYRGDGHCKMCGAEISVKRKYCDECRKIVRRNAKRAELDRRAAELNAAKEQKESKKPKISLIEAVRLADAAGMSYAKYCMKYGI